MDIINLIIVYIIAFIIALPFVWLIIKVVDYTVDKETNDEQFKDQKYDWEDVSELLEMCIRLHKMEDEFIKEHMKE